jgi:general secretion pathway protein D
MRYSTPSSGLRAVIAALWLLLASPLLHAQEQTWKINLKNADINEFVAQIAAITGKTFVVDPRVKGKVTVISNASLDANGIYELFLSVLRVHGFAAIETGEVIRIQQQTLAKQSSSPLDSAPRISGEQLVTRVIAAQYVESAELVKTLRPMIPQYGHIAAVTNPNVVIISDHAENIVRLQRIIARIDVPDEEQVVVVPLRDAWVGNVVDLLQKLAPEQIGASAKGPQRIQIIANERNNSIVLRGKSGPVSEVKRLIDQIDQPATASGATQVIRLNHGDAKAVAEIVKGLITPEGGKEGAATPQLMNVQADESLNAIVVRADPTVMGEIREIVEKLDVRRTQVLIEAAIVEISLDDSLDLGVDMAGIDRDGDSIPLFSTALSPALATILKALTPSEDGSLPAAALGALSSPTLAVAKLDPDGFSFAAVLKAISTSSKANLLSTPSILTLDNEEAKILVGQEVPFRTGTYTTTTDGANNPFTTIQRQDVGVTLTVTPHIHEGESVRLEVSQEVSQVVLSALAVSEANPFSDVVTNKRTIDTTVLADDRQTIVLGGLIQDDIQTTKKKVPLLGDIPLLGKLFQNTEDQRVKRNLLVFLRPTVLRTREDVSVATDRKYESVWDVEILGDMPYSDYETDPPMQPPVDALYDGHRE